MAPSPPRDSSADELTSLRTRAYGPDADIWRDPAALARLAELESAMHPPASDPAGTATADGAEPPRIPDPGGGDRAEPARQARRIRPGWIVAWAASIVAVGIGAGFAVHVAASPAPSSAEPAATIVATLDQPAELDSWIRRWFVDQGVGVTLYSYEGLLIARAPVGSFDSRAECIFVVAEQDVDPHDGSVDGDIQTGCGAGAFPPTVQFVVDGTAPQELRDRLGSGAGVRIVSDGGAIEVFVSEVPHEDDADRG